MMQQLHSWAFVMENFMLTLLKHKFLFPTNDFRAMPTVHLWNYTHTRGFLVTQTVKNLPAMRETQVRSLGQEDLLKKELAKHSYILAWRIPWTGKPGRLQSIGLQRVGHSWVTTLFTFTTVYLWNYTLKNLWILVNGYTKYQRSC